ncbi:phospholipase D family protein [Paenibacillus alba]|uniref:phospholipase D family protein n=1 Tax=Paenibacillus alba TaxID=1197127 RepID=UPI001FE8FFF7|nr:phospholipase D family protein [Paenibacillus alba]
MINRNGSITSDCNSTNKHMLLRKSRKNRGLQLFSIVGIFFIVLITAVAIYQSHKPMPPGMSMEGPIHTVSDGDIQFLSDLTYKEEGTTTTKQEQMIFERIYQAIDEAEQFIVIDMFLYNGFHKKDQTFPPLSRTLTDKLIAAKVKHPQLNIAVISDEINTSYGSSQATELERLRAAGIPSVITDVNPLRDSTPVYSAGWRIFTQWFGQSGHGWLPNPLADQAPDMTVRSYLKLLNVKANHRKVIITDKTLIVPSANAHDASFYNSNSGFAVNGDIVGDALLSERAAIQPHAEMQLPTYKPAGQEKGNIQVRLLTEGKVYQHVLEEIAATKSGDTLWMGMFYLADRKVIKQLLEASTRGVQLRLVLDPNENAFGNDKIGLPNRPVAAELKTKSEGQIQIRWYNTTKEQYHTKLMFIEKNDRVVIQNGSSNFTTRNLDDLNLESNLEITAPLDSGVAQQVRSYFDRIWNNKGAPFTLDYAAYEDKTVFIKRLMYTIQNWLRLTTY